MELFFPPGEGTPIHSVHKGFLFLHGHGSEHDASTAQIILVGIISLALTTNLLDGLRWGRGIVFVILFGRFLPFFPLLFVSCLLDSVLLDHLPSCFLGSLCPSPIVFPIPFW